MLAGGLACGVAQADPGQSNPPVLTILFSGSANGSLRSCHCPNSPWGGLAKRAWLMDQVRTTAGSDHVLALDSGDLFPLDHLPDQSALLLKLMGLMEYAAVGIGDQELAGGLESWIAANRNAGFWNEIAGRSTFPWLSGGYRLTSGPRQRQMLVPPWTVLKRAGMRIGMVSVTGPEAWRFSSSRPEDMELTDPVRTVQVFLEHTRGQIDLAIVLSHQGLDADRAMAEQVTGIDLIVGGHSQSLLNPPEIVNGIAICQAGKNGENLGILALAPATTTATPRPLVPVEDDPFQLTAAETPRWLIAQQIVPLTTAIEDSEPAARLIDTFYARIDSHQAERLSKPDPRATPNEPQLVVHLPTQSICMAAGERREVTMQIDNPGNAPLEIERIRSKSPWLEVTAAPERIAPGSRAEARLAIIADKIDRFFRCEFSVMANDPHRRVVQGAFSGQIEGPMSGILDVPALCSNLVELAQASLPRSTTSAMAATDAGPDSNSPSDSLDEPSLAPALDVVVEEVASTNRPSGPVLVSSAPAIQDPIPARRVLVEFFYAPDCTECQEVEHQILPAILDRFGGAVDFRKLDVSIPANYLRLATLQERLAVRANKPVSIYVAETIAVLGLNAIRDNLESIIADRLAAHPVLEPNPPSPNQAIPEPHPDTAPPVLTERLRSFTLPAILLAGLVDGINPCAFATIVFFITLLTVTGVRQRGILAVGLGFSLAVFATYLLLGLGAFRALRWAMAWPVFQAGLRWGLLALLVVLAALSFRDAWVFQRRGDASAVALQLPARIKLKIHAVMREHLRSKRLFLSALGIGALVTLLEAACTGQVYLPTLALMSRYAETRGKAFPLLLLYNLMFIVPLLVVMGAAFFGTRNQRLLAWSRHNVVWGKITMGLLFATMALILLWL